MSQTSSLGNTIYNMTNTKLSPKLKPLVTKCSNPIYKHTQPCLALWNEIDRLNKNIEPLEYSICSLRSHDFEKFTLFDEDLCVGKEHTEECRIYD